MHRRTIEYVLVGRLDLPKDLAEDVKLLLMDPRTGRTQYGKLRQISTMLWSNWVDEQRSVPRSLVEVPDLV